MFDFAYNNREYLYNLETQFPIKLFLKIIPKSNLNFKAPKSKLEGKINPMR